MSLNQDFIAKVLESNDIIEVIGQDTQLKGRGSQFMGLCPFPSHKERTPSFSVNQDKQVYHCFGCKESGNLITYLRTLRGMSFIEAVEYLANRAGFEMPALREDSLGGGAARDSNQELFKINEAAAAFYFRKLMSLSPEDPVRKYLSQRQISADTVQTFQVGYAPDEWETLTSFLRENRHPLSEAQRVGLVRERTKGKTGFFDQ
ncbi:MAG: DNA primase, partial [Bdellovibrionales bacterium]|nr:DNA primase [Bdellovibrionales bacterium]